MKERKTEVYKLALLVLVWAVFWIKGALFLDPDFGWRARVGKLILEGGIPKTDPFSYTMPSFPFVDHAWLSSLGLAKLYPAIGMVGLSAAASLAFLSSLIISASTAKVFTKLNQKDLLYFASIPFFLAAATVMPFYGVRVQVLSWLMLAVFLRVSLDSQLYLKWRFLLPAYFALWANLHGGFAAGLGAYILVIVLRAYRQRKIEIVEILIFLACLLATLVNPYGVDAWREVWSSATDASLKWRILEWMPAIFMFDLAFPSFLTFSLLLVLRHRSRFRLEELGLYFAFLLQAILSRRHIPLWVVVALPLTISSVNFFYREISGQKGAISRFKKVLRYGLYISLVMFILQAFLSLGDGLRLSEGTFYPKNALSFLQSYPEDGRIFSKYGWGGYLIWKLPEEKVFVDGRMPSWRWKPGNQKESASAFDEYNDLLAGKIEYSQVFAKYGVDTVVWPVPKRVSFLEYLQQSLYFLFAKSGEKDFDLLKALQEDGWEKVYQDSVAVIYKKP